LGKKYANYRTKFSIVKYEAEEQKIPKMSLWRKLEGKEKGIYLLIMKIILI